MKYIWFLKKTLVGLIKLYPRLHLFKFIFSLWFKVESWSKFLFEYVYKSNVLYRVLQTTKTTANHQQCNQEMLSSSITSMRFYFIFPYVPQKKNIYAPSNQTHRTAIHVKFQRVLTVVRSQVNCENMLYFIFWASCSHLCYWNKTNFSTSVFLFLCLLS